MTQIGWVVWPTFNPDIEHGSKSGSYPNLNDDEEAELSTFLHKYIDILLQAMHGKTRCDVLNIAG